jgi:hypothetical protein
MKAFRLQETTVTNSQAAEDLKLNYRREFLRMVEIIPEGVTASQMDSAIKVARKLRDTPDGGTVFLEDAEWEYLKQRAETHKFSLVAPEIVEMIAALRNAKTCEAPHLKQEPEEKAKEAGA